MSSNFEDQSISRRIADAANEVCSGEILQTQRRFDLKLSIPEYIKIISMKTGALFRISTELAAVLNAAGRMRSSPCATTAIISASPTRFTTTASTSSAPRARPGKTVGTDLAKGKLTLPLLHVLAQANDAERERLHTIILHGTEENRTELLAQVVERGGLKNAVRRIQSYLDQAIASLQVLPKTSFRRNARGHSARGGRSRRNAGLDLAGSRRSPAPDPARGARRLPYSKKLSFPSLSER